MRVIEDHLLIAAELVDRRPTAFALKQLQDLAVSSREYGRIRRRHDVDSIVSPAFRTALREGVDQLIRTDTGDWNNQRFFDSCNRLDHGLDGLSNGLDRFSNTLHEWSWS